MLGTSIHIGIVTLILIMDEIKMTLGCISQRQTGDTSLDTAAGTSPGPKKANQDDFTPDYPDFSKFVC